VGLSGRRVQLAGSDVVQDCTTGGGVDFDVTLSSVYASPLTLCVNIDKKSCIHLSQISKVNNYFLFYFVALAAYNEFFN